MILVPLILPRSRHPGFDLAQNTHCDDGWVFWGYWSGLWFIGSYCGHSDSDVLMVHRSDTRRYNMTKNTTMVTLRASATSQQSMNSIINEYYSIVLLTSCCCHKCIKRSIFANITLGWWWQLAAVFGHVGSSNLSLCPNTDAFIIKYATTYKRWISGSGQLYGVSVALLRGFMLWFATRQSVKSQPHADDSGASNPPP